MVHRCAADQPIATIWDKLSLVLKLLRGMSMSSRLGEVGEEDWNDEIYWLVLLFRKNQDNREILQRV